MSADPSRIDLMLHQDDRLLAAIDAVVVHAGERAGLSEGEQQGLAQAAAEACDEAFLLASRNGNSDPVIELAVCDFPGRVEIAIEHAGESCVNRQRANVDQVKCDVHEGKSRTTLVKFSRSGSERKV